MLHILDVDMIDVRLADGVYMVPDINNDKMCYCQSENRNVRES